MADLSAVAKEIFQILRSFNYTVRLYDENGMAVGGEVENARRFMCYPKNLMVSLIDDDDNSRVTLNIGQTVHINDIMGLDQNLRTIANKYNMIFRAQQYGKAIEPKDFAELASISEDIAMHVSEGMYGTSRSSYLRLENARMIVRHQGRLDDRASNVEAVFVENRNDRHQMPTIHLLAGRAMTQHVNQGGTFTDPIGKRIVGMANEHAKLQTGVKTVTEFGNPMRRACRLKMAKLDERFVRLARVDSYGAMVEAMMPSNDWEAEWKRVADRYADRGDAAGLWKAMQMYREAKGLAHGEEDEMTEYMRGLLFAKEPPTKQLLDGVVEACRKAVDEMNEAAPTDAHTFSYGGKERPNARLKSDDWQKPWQTPIGPDDEDDEAEPVEECGKEPVAEGPRQVETMKVLGLPIGKAAWEAFWQDHKLDMSSLPNFALKLKDKMDDLAYRLGQVSAVVQDDGLSNLFDRVASELPMETDAKRRQIYRSIAMRALQAAATQPSEPEKLADKNPIVSEHLNWLRSFNPERILTELDWHPMTPSSELMPYAADDALANFNAGEFVHSPQMQEVISGRDPESADNHLSREAIMTALTEYFQNEMAVMQPDAMGGMDDPASMATSVYGAAVNALHDEGYVVDDDEGLVEGMDDELTIEDVLLPKHDQGADLSKEVTTQDVTDPNQPDRHMPADSAYTNRLMTLAGMRSGDQY